MSDHSNSVKLGEIIQEFGLEILHPGANYASIPLTTLDVNRPGLPLTGFLRMFCNEFMHSYPVYLLKRILATYFRYRRASFFFFHSRLLLTIPQTARISAIYYAPVFATQTLYCPCLFFFFSSSSCFCRSSSSPGDHKSSSLSSNTISITSSTRQSRILHKVSTVCVEIYKFFRSLFN